MTPVTPIEDQKAVGPMVALAPVVDLAPVGPRQGEDQGLIVVVVTASMVTSGRGQVVVGVHLMMLLVHLMVVTPHGVAMSPVSVWGAVGLASVVTSVAMALNGRQVVLVSGHGSGRSSHLVEARNDN